MLGHDSEMSCAKFQGKRFRIDGDRNRRKACAPDNCVIDYSHNYIRYVGLCLNH